MRLVFALLVAALGWALTPTAHATGTAPDVTVEPGTGFSRAQLAEIRALVDDATVPSRVLILRRLPKSAAGSPRLHAQHVQGADDPADPSATVVFTPSTLPEYGAVSATDPQDLASALHVAEELEGSPQERFVELVRMVTTRTGNVRFEEQLAEIWEEPLGSEGDQTGDPPSTGTKALRWAVIAVGVLLVLLFLGFRGRAIAGWWRRHRRASELEEVAEVANAKSLFDRAKADVEAFGRAIDAESMDEHDALELWNLALDDYDEAARLFDARTGPTDDAKVIKICARGQDRLAKAQR